ncbi:MAG: PD-(D/E)XK nuclease family protein [Candidatus Binatia bacterium]
MKRSLTTPAAHERIDAARNWLDTRSASEQLLVVAATKEAASELVRAHALRSPAAATFGWYRATLERVAAELAADVLAEKNLVPVTAFAAVGVVTRVVQRLRASGELGRYEPIAHTPGFPRAVAATLDELRRGGLEPEALRAIAPELAILMARYAGALRDAGLVDRAAVFRLAVERVRSGADHAWLGVPTLFLDVEISSRAEAELVAAITERAPEALATVPSGDERTAARLASAGFASDTAAAAACDGRLRRLQARLFEALGSHAVETLGDDVVILSAPGESRECVEIARRLLRHAREGVPFDRMAVLLRSPDEYRAHLEEAFDRAGIPAYFARGAVRPDPSGRAFVALLACAAERFSAKRFAEYLSLSEVPELPDGREPPPARPSADRWVPPDDELVPEVLAEGRAESTAERADEPADAVESAAPGGSLRVPRRWEDLLVESAVIGGLDRWRSRLDGLEKELGLDLLELDDPDDPAAEMIRRRLADLDSLRGYALPVLEELAALPARAPWGEWLDRLSALATRVLRRPERVLASLAELAPMWEVGPVDLDEVRLVLAERLLEIAVPPPKSRHGRVFVAPADRARGLSFDVVCVPGLAEKLFPRSVREDPILVDAARAALAADLATNEDRVRAERQALRLAVGAAERTLVFSYPRLDLDKGRPRVPSFYGLEAVRAAEGRLPGFDELAARAEHVAQTRIGWPAPLAAEDAIDEAEHDLAVLEAVIRLDEERSVGMARYLLDANPHLGRALRFRARRWLRRWTPADGLLDPGPAALEALSRHRLAERSFSPTALENFATCPYRFLLHAIHRLAPREVPEPLEEMSPLQRGSLVHEVQFDLFRRLDEERLLPVVPSNLERARGVLDEVIAAVADRYREELAPAIVRVWEAGVDGVRADLREWLRRMSEDDSGFVPWRFELAFGLRERRNRDRHSIPEPVDIEGGLKLRGSIDLVERDGAARLRITDHKTGAVRFPKDGVVVGGTLLQPVLYALAMEKVFPDATVVEGRLHYCTSTGGYEVRTVPLDREARGAARSVAEAVEDALTRGFLPALPKKGACAFCDYAIVCGPYEEARTRRKPADRRLDPLLNLRERK